MPKRKPTAKKVTKAAFVRSLPASMPAKEVIAKGKEQGLTLTEDTVYKTRSLANAKKARKVTAAKGKGKRGSKKARVLEQVAAHPDWTADRIAKAAGATASYVYAVWRKGTNGKGKAFPSSSNGATTEFYRAVKRVGGVAKAKELLATIEAYESA
jgi:hypothetical protein